MNATGKLVIAWRWGWVGVILFLALGLLYPVVTGGRFSWSVYLSISGPLFLLAVLFLLDWAYGSRVQAPREGA